MVTFFRCSPLKKYGNFAKTVGEGSPKSHCLSTKETATKWATWEEGVGGWGGGQFPYFLFLLGASFNIEIALAMQSYNFFDIS